LIKSYERILTSISLEVLINYLRQFQVRFLQLLILFVEDFYEAT